ncbi:RIIB lysis inhibitor [Vibrio phage F86]
MVNLSLHTKRCIVRASANGMTQKAIAEKYESSPTTVRRVLAEHREGKFSLKPSKQTKPAKAKTKAKANKQKTTQKALTDLGKAAAKMAKVAGGAEVKAITEVIKPEETDKEFAYVITPMNVSFTFNGEAYSADMTTPDYQGIVAALIANDGAKAVSLLDLATGIDEFMQGHVSVSGGVVRYRGLIIDGGMTNRIIDAMKAGDHAQVEKLVTFFGNLINNPSKRAIDELYGFLEAADIELTDDGHFLAYKRVRDSFKDIHSNTMCNKPGTTVWMQRHEVNDNKDQTCSAGLHVCSKGYLPHFGNCASSRTLLCKVNPRDVVSVPSDYNNTKLRCNEYLVLTEIDKNFKPIVTKEK